MRVWVLGSGSRGNAILLERGDSRVLVDAGFAPRALACRLAVIGVPPESIEAVVVTHEHSDHVGGAAAAARLWGWAVYASEGTARGARELLDADVRTFEAGGTIALGAFDLRTVPTPHDAEEPVALVATARASGARVGIAYDMGHASTAVRDAMRDLDVLVIEANHDDDMLRTGPYPVCVQQRIAGRTGHLSNAQAARLARDCAHGALGQVVLAHLSEKCNRPESAVAAVADALRPTRFRGGLSPASQGAVAGPFMPSARRRAAAAQLSLGL